LSSGNLNELRRHLAQFFARPGAGTGNQRLRLVVRIHGYNVPLKSVEKEFSEAECKFADDARPMAASPPDDYVLFVHYAWPSERFGAGGPWRWIRAMPAGLLLLFGLGGVLGVAASGLFAVLGQLLLGIGITLTLLRVVVYFRDRERASSFGVFDAVEMIRALHHLIKEIGPGTGFFTDRQGGDTPRVSLSFMAHSMGTFLTTSLIRVLSNVFDPEADRHLWESNAQAGPFAGRRTTVPAAQDKGESLRRQLANIGELFELERLILVAADIPVWAITTGRSNHLASCLRRFQDTFLFVNDADMVLRLASTLANYFVFPSGTRVGGYRLGNLSVARRGPADGYGWRVSDLSEIRLNGWLRAASLCDGQTFRSRPWIGHPLNIIDCTDYTDHGRHLSAFTAGNALLRPFNYAATLALMVLPRPGTGRIDSHGGYFRGRFCLNLLYTLALYGVPVVGEPGQEIQKGLRKHQIGWIRVPSSAPVPR